MFSVLSGRMVRKLAAVSTGRYQLATPAAADDGRLFLTFTSGAVCAPKGVYAECPRFAPASCRNSVETWAPGQTMLRPLFTLPGSQAIIGEVAPNPTGSEVALTRTPCVNLHSTTGLFVRGLSNGVTRAIVTSSNRCDGFGPAAWSPTGGELVFPLDRAIGSPIPMAGGIGCPEARNYLALASASGSGQLKLVDPDRGCIFAAAAFDRLGIVAAEGCSQGDPEHGVGSYLGHAYLLQYDPQGRMTMRVSLEVGLEQAVVASEPNTGDVLITQDQPANEPYRERDWVWEFDGQTLRPIANYKAEDAAQVLAVPW